MSYYSDDNYKSNDEDDNHGHDELLKQRRYAKNAYRNTREAGDLAMKMFIGGAYHWTADDGSEYYNNQIRITVNNIPQFVRQHTNDLRNNFPAFRCIPTSEDSKDIAEIIDGRLRYVINRLASKPAIINAAEDAAIRGEGYWHITREYVNENSFEQDIVIEEIPNPTLVLVDPTSIKMDRTDAEWISVDSLINEEDFKAQYPDFTFVNQRSLDGDDSEQYKDLFNAEDPDCMVICDHYQFEKQNCRPLYKVKRQGEILVVEKKEKGDIVLDEREISDRVLRHRRYSPIEVFEDTYLDFKYIPIVPVLGEQLEVDGVRVLKGMVADLVDAQRMINYCQSAMVQMIGTMPKAKYILTKQQIAGLEKYWQQDHLYQYPYKLYNSDPTANKPTLETSEPPIAALMQTSLNFFEWMKSAAGIYDPSLGDKSNERSGIAIKERKLQGDMATYHLVDNFNLSMGLAGRILVDIFQKIHDIPQTIAIENNEGNIEHVRINEQTMRKGKPVFYGVKSLKDLEVNIEVGTNYKSRREEMAADLKELVTAVPELLKVLGDEAVDYMYNMPEITERMKFYLAPNVQQYLEQSKQSNNQISPEIAQVLAMKDQQLNQLSAAINQLLDEKEREQEKAQRDIILKQMENKTKEEIANRSSNTQILLKAMEHGHQAAHTVLQAETDINKSNREELKRQNPEAQPL